jgi:hypothetical protein
MRSALLLVLCIGCDLGSELVLPTTAPASAIPPNHVPASVVKPPRPEADLDLENLGAPARRDGVAGDRGERAVPGLEVQP